MVDGYAGRAAAARRAGVFLLEELYESSELQLGTTIRLSEDRVFEKLLFRIPAGDEKLGHRYSVLVRQFALTKEGYDFYQLMKKNTESLGTIFDPQPSEITGNIRSLSDPAEKVIGFIKQAPVQEARIFISKDEVPRWGFRLFCSEEIKVPNNRDSINKYFVRENYLPYSAERRGVEIESYKGAQRQCVDCTVRNGSTVMPAFW
jgi:hypothetical protein